MKCPVCGQAYLVHDVRDIPYIYKGESTLIPNVEADWCNACGESLTGPAESKRVMLAMNLARQQVNARAGHLELIKAVRKQLKLTQKQAGELFGGGPNAFSRYEKGDVDAPTALVKLFQLLQKHPELGDEVKRAG
ncbi:YgiT-type zinc finger protein [Pseudomonas sp. DY-1]|uniref:type II TA system antitoxin MqsA family protein n=1 Tax=Pseudomonas sp. DY-1 TaxID=1755504 RepID=UPI000EA8FE4A|nr:type II TA system antitoxin MqsA family protein [Pseudomonas sp. DY-1]AYF87212.1 YgiT-type zinc finger protein [Pseudomonas sp. DY-1]